MTSLGPTCFSSSPVFSGVLPPGRPLNRCDERCPAKTRVGLPSQVGAAVIIRLPFFCPDSCGRLQLRMACPSGFSFLSCRLFCDVFYFRKPASRYRSARFFVVFLRALSVGGRFDIRLWQCGKTDAPCAVRAGESEEGGRAVSGKVSAENCEAVMDILLFCPWRQGTAACDAPPQR